MNPERTTGGHPQAENYTVASLRLPVEVKVDSDGLPVAKPTIGGMASAIDQSLGSLRGTNRARWIGWHGNGNGEIGGLDEALMTASREKSFDMIGISLSEDDVKHFYLGYSNDVIWPLFHGFTELCNLEQQDYWPSYQDINKRYAQVIAEASDPDDFIWIQDYHLLLAGRELKALGTQNRIGTMLHIPFPPYQTFAKLPLEQGRELIDGMLSFDLIGFHTVKDVNHFIDCVRADIPSAVIEYPSETSRRIITNFTSETGETIRRVTMAEAHPIGIDAEELERQGAQEHIQKQAQKIKEKYPEQKILFDASRADYTKGIPEGMLAFETAIEKYPDLIKGNVKLVQVMAPSRKGIPAYDRLWQTVQDLHERIDTNHKTDTWNPIDLQLTGLTGDQMKAHLKAADIGYIKTLIDGFNLVAPEYLTLCPDDGVLLLGQNAGAATLLYDSALLIDPTDHEQTADKIKEALTMPENVRRARILEGRRIVYNQNIHAWAQGYMKSLRQIKV